MSVVGLSQTCKKVSMGCDWSVTVVREGCHGGLMVCRRRVRVFPWGVVGLLQKCERESMWCD